jgi:hypothetical protein
MESEPRLLLSRGSRVETSRITALLRKGTVGGVLLLTGAVAAPPGRTHRPQGSVQGSCSWGGLPVGRHTDLLGLYPCRGASKVLGEFRQVRIGATHHCHLGTCQFQGMPPP